MSLGKVSIAIEAQMASFESDMGRAARVADKELKKIERDAKRTEEQMRRIGKAIGLAMVAGATAATVALKGAINAMDDMSKAAQRSNMPTEDFSRLAYAGSLADVSMEDLAGSLAKLAKAQGDAGRATSVQGRLFDALGISVKNADGTMRDTGEVFKDFADRFQEMKGSPEIMAAGMNIFGRSFQKLIPLMKDGAEGLSAAGIEADKLGITLSTKAGQQAEAFNDNLTRLQTVAQGLVQTVAVQLLPELIEISEKFLDAANDGDTARVAVDSLKASFDGIISIGSSVVSTGESIRSILSGIGGDADDSAESLRQLIQSARGLAAIPASMAAYLDAQATGSDEAVARFRAANAEISAAWTGKPAGQDESAGVANPGYLQGLDVLGTGQPFSAVGQMPFSAVGAPSKIDRAAVAAAMGDVPKGAAGAKKSDAEREAESLQRAYASLMDSQKERIALFGQETEVSKVTYDTQFGGLSKLAEADKAALIANAEKLDVLKAEAEAQKALDDIEKDRLKTIDRNRESVDAMIGDMQFELALLGMTNAEREREIALRYAGKDATDAQRAAIVGLTDQLIAAREATALLDDFKRGLSDAFVDFASGAKSAKDAFGDFADSLFKRALQFVADKAIEQMFSAFSGQGQQGGGGGQGFNWGGLIGSLFGGGKAAGGPVSGSKFYEVGEQNRPEMFHSRGKQYLIPGNEGNVIPFPRGGQGNQQTVNFHMAAPTDPRTQSQIAARVAFETNRATARNR